MSSEIKEHLSVAETARRLECHPNKVRALIRKNILRPVFLGDAVRPFIPVEQVEELRSEKVLPRAPVISEILILGIGFHSGSTAALMELIAGLPRDPAMALVLMGYNKEPRGLLTQLREKADMPVHRARDGMLIDPGNAYLIPAGTKPSIRTGRIAIAKEGGGLDVLFTALAEEFQGNVVSILLDGTGKAGIEGSRTILAKGGTAFVQDEKKRSGAQGVLSLPLKEIQEKIHRIIGASDVPQVTSFGADDQALRRIFQLVLEKRRIDLTRYKRSTVDRRLIRRMVIKRVADLASYAEILERDPNEVDGLAQDMLINVTRFFRDPEVLGAMRSMLPKLIAGRPDNEPLRIWVPGCATGEEVVSIGILLLETLGEKALSTQVQIFATDLNEKAIARARQGIYPADAVKALGAARQKRFFVPVKNGHQVIKAIRDMCIFAKHDLLKDPPFSRLDLISCQNVLIYLEFEAQAQVLKQFHFALRPSGILLLGRSETSVPAGDIFHQPKADLRIYVRKELPNEHGPLKYSSQPSLQANLQAMPQNNRPHPGAPISNDDLDRTVDEILQKRHLPASVLVNKDLEIIRFKGNTSPFLSPSSGKASLGLLKMVRKELVSELRPMLYKARRERLPVTRGGIQISSDDRSMLVALEVRPLTESATELLVVFQAMEIPESYLASVAAKNGQADDGILQRRIQALEAELNASREQMRIIAEDSETINQELQSANEEIVSSNEELQSINEELETSKEELQSVNEEFATINEELQLRNDALRKSEQRLRESEQRYRDLVELMPVGVYACDAQGTIILYNEAAARIWGREPKLTAERWCGSHRLVTLDGKEVELEHCAMAQVIRTGERTEVEIHVERPNGELRTIISSPTPMLDEEGNVTGAVNVMIDVTERRKMEDERQQFTNMLERSLNEIYIFDLETLKFEYVNHGALRNLGFTLEQMRHMTPLDIKPDFTHAEFERIVTPLREGGIEKLLFNTVHRRADGSDYPVEVHLQCVNNGTRRLFMAMILDITERRLGEERLRVATQTGKLGIWDWDVENDTITWTDPVFEIHGVEKGSFEPSLPGYTQLIHPEDRERVGKAIRATLEKDAPYEIEFRTLNERQEVNWVYTSGVVLRDKGRPVRMLGGTMNITRRKNTEEAARKLAAIVETSQDAILSADVHGVITSWNKGCERIFGDTEVEAIGHHVSMLMPNERHQEQLAILERIRSGERVAPFESQRLHKDGTLVDLSITLSPILREDGSMSGISMIAHDITDRKQAEREKQETQERFQLLADNMDQLAWIAAADGSTMWFNKRWREFSGIPEDEIHERSATHLHHPSHYDRVVTTLQACAEKGEVWECTFPMKRKDGVWRWFLSRAIPVKDHEGVVYRWFGTSTDITEQMEAQEVLRESEARFHLLADSMDQLAWVAEADGHIGWYNKRWLEYTGTTISEMEGWGWEKVHHPDHLDRVKEQWKQALATGHEFEMEFPLRGADGIYRPFLTRANAVRNENGRILQWFGTCTDISSLKETEERIRESEDRFRTLVDQLPHSLQIIDPEGQIVRVNQAWEDLFGVTLEDVRDHNLFQDPQLVGSGVMALIDKARNGTPVEFPPNKYIPDRGRFKGKEIWTRGIMYPVLNEHGAVRELVLIHEDHTARRAADNALRESESRLRASFEQSAAGFALTDIDGRFVQVNGYFCQMLGYEQEELLRMRMQDVTHPEDLTMNLELFRKAKQEGVKFDLEKRYLRKDGSAVWVHVSVAPITDANGRVDRILGVSVDLTERKKAEALRQESEARFRQMANNAPVFIWISDTEKRYIWFNNAWLDFVGRTMEEELDRGWMMDLHPEDRARFQTMYDEAFDQRRPFSMDYRMKRADGRYRWVYDHGTPMYDGHGEFIGYIGSSMDIHDRKEAEHALAESARQKDQFLATLAHELRNPLAPIRNGIQLLEIAGDDPELGPSTRAMMERQMNHLVRLVDDLMDLSRISRGKIELRKENIDLREIVETAVESSRPFLQQRHHQLVLDLPENAIVVNGDAMRLTQSVTNLVNNACKYTSEGGRIEVGLSSRGREAMIRVKDSGIGIEPDKLPMVFEMFTQVDPKQKTDPAGGLGIGLSIVQRLCKMHGGSVHGHSEGYGKGSEFTITLPISRDMPKKRTVKEDKEPGVNGRRTILVVDDNQDAAFSMGAILKKQGHSVHVAHDGVQAVKAAEEVRPDIVFMDIGMPLMNGFEACEKIRGSAWGQDIFMVALSGWGQAHDIERSRQAGFDKHFVKPIAPKDLDELLN